MHEYTVTEELIRVVIEETERHKFSSIKKIKVVLGRLTGFFSESIKYYFELLKGDYEVLREAEIVFEERKGEFKCMECGLDFEGESYFVVCPKCGGLNVKAVGGKDFFIEYLEGEQDVSSQGVKKGS